MILSRKSLQELYESETIKRDRQRKQNSKFILDFIENAKLSAKTQSSYVCTITAERNVIVLIRKEIQNIFLNCDVSKLVIYTGECGNYADIHVKWD